MKAFLDQVRSEHEKGGGGLLSGARKLAWTRLEEMGAPHGKSEDFSHVPMKHLYDVKLAHIVGAAPTSNSESLGLSLMDMKGVLPTYGPYLEKRMRQSIQSQRCPIALMNLAIDGAGTFIYLPRGEVLGEPLHIMMEESAPYSKLFIFADEGAKGDIIISQHGEVEAFENHWIDISLEAGAHVTCHLDVRGAGVRFNRVEASLKRDSFLETRIFSTGSRLNRFTFEGDLMGEGAFCDVKGFAYCQGSNEMHTQVQINHRAPHTRSNQLITHLLADRAKTSFAGKIYVEKEAQQTNAYQLNRNMLLSGDAVAHTKPGLEIFADDVKASHGATVASIDEELEFYLRARGLSKEEGRRFLIRAFTREMLEQIPLEGMRQEWDQMLCQP